MLQSTNVGPAVEAVKFHEQLPAILRRDNSDESIAGLQPYDYSVPVDSADVSGSIANGAAAARASGVLYPNTTTTAGQVFTTVAGLTTTTSLVPLPAVAEHSCTSESDVLETVVVTVTVVPQPSQPPSYGSISGYSSISSDATVTGNPATVTSVQTDISYTSTPPDATVSGDPATVTNVETDTHFTSGPPDATVSGDPATVTSIVTNTATASESMTTLTYTSYSTVLVTVTRSSSTSIGYDSSVLGDAHTTSRSDYASDPVVTYTETVTVTDGVPVTSTTTIELPAQYGDDYPTPYGTGLRVNVTATTSYTYIPPIVGAGVTVCSFRAVYLVLAAIAAICFF